MKKLVLSLLICFGTINSFATDVLREEVVCNKVDEVGNADNGMSVILLGNSTAWMKVVQVFQNGVLGSLKIAEFQVPIQPEITGGGSGFIPEVDLVYRGQGGTLSLRALHIKDYPLAGSGKITFAIKGSSSQQFNLICLKQNN